MNLSRTVVMTAPYFPPQGGGLERYVFETSKLLSKEHHWRVIVITTEEQGSKVLSKSEENGITLYRLPYTAKYSNTPFSFGWFSQIKKILAEENPDILNIHTPVPGIGDVAACVAKNIPIIVTYHACSMKKGSLFKDLLVNIYENTLLRLLLSKARYIICSSDAIRFNFLSKYIYKSKTITPAADYARFFPDHSKRSKEPTILFVAGLGRSEKHKGLTTLIDAVVMLRSQFPSLRLAVSGDGDMRSEYEAYTKKCGLSDAVTFYGRLDGQDLVTAFQSAQVFSLPSSNESFGMAIVEAMSSGLPVVSTTVGGIPTVVENGVTGYLVQPNDAKALANKIALFLNDPDLAEQFGSAGRKKVTSAFCWHTGVRELNTILETHTFRKESPRHLCVVSPYFFPKIGGAENYALNIAKRIHSSGDYRVSIITSSKSALYSQDIVEDMVVHRLPTLLRVSNTPMSPTWYWWMKSIFKAEKPDIIWAHAPVVFMADMAAVTHGSIPLVVTYHSGSMLKGKWPIDTLIYLYEKVLIKNLFRGAAAVVAVSQDILNRMVPQRIPNRACIQPGVDTTQFMPSPLPEGASNVTFVGRIERTSSWKGIDYLIQAIALVRKTHPEVRLELVGGGDAIADHITRVRELGIQDRVTFSGILSGADLAAAYRRASVVVLPSTSESESFGMTLVEAMASGRPVIGTRIGGIPAVIDDNVNGILVEPKSPAELASAIIRVISDRSLASRFADEGAKKARMFDWSIQTEAYRKLLSSIINS